MASPISPELARKFRDKMFRRTGNITLLLLTFLLISCIVFTWDTRDAMLRLPFLSGSVRTRAKQEKALVDVTPWQRPRRWLPSQ